MEVRLYRQPSGSAVVSRIAGIAVFAVLTALSGFVRIPVPCSPVPITLQTFFVILSGACLGRKWSAASQLSFIMAGVLGCPVFAPGAAGSAYLAGPTGGYLAGFVVAALFAGQAAPRAKSFAGLCAVFALADGMILTLGMLWLMHMTGVSLSQALMAGVLPFIPGDILKILAAAGVYRLIRVRWSGIFP